MAKKYIAEKVLRRIAWGEKLRFQKELTETLKQENMILESYFIFKFNSRLDIVEERIVKLEGKFVEVDIHSPSK